MRRNAYSFADASLLLEELRQDKVPRESIDGGRDRDSYLGN